jgi:hypothetical protein
MSEKLKSENNSEEKSHNIKVWERYKVQAFTLMLGLVFLSGSVILFNKYIPVPAVPSEFINCTTLISHDLNYADAPILLLTDRQKEMNEQRICILKQNMIPDYNLVKEVVTWFDTLGFISLIFMVYIMMDIKSEKLKLWERMVMPTTFLLTAVPFFLCITYILRYRGIV